MPSSRIELCDVPRRLSHCRPWHSPQALRRGRKQEPCRLFLLAAGALLLFGAARLSDRGNGAVEVHLEPAPVEPQGAPGPRCPRGSWPPRTRPSSSSWGRCAPRQDSWASTITVSLSRSTSPVLLAAHDQPGGVPAAQLARAARRSRWMPMVSSPSARVSRERGGDQEHHAAEVLGRLVRLVGGAAP